MNREEFIEFVSKNDGRRGNFEATLRRKGHRERRINTINGKIIELADFLRKKGIPFMVMEMVFRAGVKHPMFAEIYIPKYRIAIRCVDDNDYSRKLAGYFYLMARKLFYPVFVRHDETIDFIIEKLENTIQNAVESPREGKLKQNLLGAKPKRTRIMGVKVSR